MLLPRCTGLRSVLPAVVWHAEGMKRKSKPCSSCGHWFTPNPRLGSRQRTCGASECQAKRRRTMQRTWRERNPDYFSERRLRAQLERASAPLETAGPAAPSSGGEQRSLPRPPPRESSRIPWTLVQSAFGPQVPVLIAFLVRMLVRPAQFTIPGKSRVVPKGSVGSPRTGGQSATDSISGFT
jgi:hypothetical protein